MNSPPKKRGAHLEARSSPTPRSSLVLACQLLRIVQAPAAWLFWTLEQRIAKIDIEIERRRS